jgi:creatinine deaminase
MKTKPGSHTQPRIKVDKNSLDHSLDATRIPPRERQATPKTASFQGRQRAACENERMIHEWHQTAAASVRQTASDPGFEAAYQAAQKSAHEGGIPIGAALIRDGVVIGSGHNERIQNGDPIAHGEMSALRAAGRQKSYRDITLYTTLAPCAMCSGTITQFKIPRVVVGEARTFDGELDLLRSRGVEVVVLDDQRCVDMMRTFQEDNPDVWAEDIAE